MVDFVVRADVEKNDLIGRETKNQDDPIGVGQTDRVFVAVFSFEAVKAQLRCMRVRFELKKNILEQTGQFRVTAKELAGRAFERRGPYQRESRHRLNSPCYASDRRLFINSFASPRRTRPSLRSASEIANRASARSFISCW